MSYTNEEQMSLKFRETFLADLPNYTLVGTEIRASMGIPDYIVLEQLDGKDVLTSYELKLFDWKRALKQAFRHRTFANQSYVVMDEARCSSAIRNIELFKQYNIGLATFGRDSRFKVHYQPTANSPFSEYSYMKVVEKVKSKTAL